MNKRRTNYTNQCTIVHISDLHFGSKHICNPEEAGGAVAGIRQIKDLVAEDLSTDFGATFSSQTNGVVEEPPVFLAVTGDFTQIAEHTEFKQADEFLTHLCGTQILGQSLKKSDVFLIPGNHDVIFTKATPEERFQPYANFYNKFYAEVREPIFPHEVNGITQVHKIVKGDNKVIIAEINCCMYVERDTVNASRGQVDHAAIGKLHTELEKLKENSDFDDYIKVALIHHHVVLLPSFIQAGRGVDSVVNARLLLEVLSEFDFHVILHGHKHYPHIFSYDPLPLWNDNELKIPQLVISGGSCSSDELPNGPVNSCNTYSVVNIKWHPAAKQVKVRVTTRGLVRKGRNGRLLSNMWKWKTVNVSEKVITPRHSLPSPKDADIEEWTGDGRPEIYAALRGQMPVVEVMPSLIPGQAYEARMWIVPHKSSPDKEKSLASVRWSAGPHFPAQTVNIEMDNRFCAAFHYWGPMLVEAFLTFKDNHTATYYLYARIPQGEE